MSIDREIDEYEELMEWVGAEEERRGLNITITFARQGLILLVASKTGERQLREVLPWTNWLNSIVPTRMIQLRLQSMAYDFTRRV